MIWKLGIPGWVKKTIWPLTIGNRLEVTRNLYNILLKQVSTSLEDEETMSKLNYQIRTSVTKMNEDLKSDFYKNQIMDRLKTEK
jgi:hypothetical protein